MKENNFKNMNSWLDELLKKYDTYSMTSLTFDMYKDNIYHRRCKAIEEELTKNGIVAYVSRVFVGKHNYYHLLVDCDDKRVFESDIRDALNIPFDCIGIVSNDPVMYLIDEDMIHDLYCNSEGELVFDFDAQEATVSQIQKRLDDHDLMLDVNFTNINNTKFICITADEETDWTFMDISKALDLHPDMIGVGLPGMVWFYKHNGDV
mgnify:CR=1 FL=1